VRPQSRHTQYGIEASTDMEALYLGFDKGVDANQDGTITLAEGKGDGKITAAEAESLGLKIWRDADMDGVVDAGEMVSFAAAGIDFIDLNATNVDELKEAQDGAGAEADDIIEARFADGSVIFGTATVQLSNGAKTTAYDMGLAHEKLGMIEYEDAAGFINKVRLERAGGTTASNWQYREAAIGSAAVNWDFDQAANAVYYGATGSDYADTMVYSGTSRRSFSGGGGNDTLRAGDGDDFLIGGAGADLLYGRGGERVHVFAGNTP
jgi:Ca2+-binding RTX toxin-like protein